MDSELFVALGALAIMLGGFVKGITGMGAPTIAVPLLASLYSIPVALSVMAVPAIVSNIWQVWTTRKEKEGRVAMWRMATGCGVGVALGTMLLGLVPEKGLSIVLAGLILAFIGLRLLRPTFQIVPERARKAALPVGLLTGILHGSTGLSGPVSITFVVAQRLPRESQIFVLSVIFIALTATQAVSLTAVGLMTSSLFRLSLLAVLPLALGIWLGQHIGRRAGTRLFEILSLLVLFATALVLLGRALPAGAA